MTMLSSLSREDVAKTKQNLDTRIAESNALDEASQVFTDTVYDRFKEDSALVRLYCTVAYDDLPDANKAFVHAIADDNGVTDRLSGETPILSLMGTTGKEDAWCDRKKSHGHIGIPMVSSAFVDTIPMVSRLLQQMGVGIDWVDTADLRSAVPGAAQMSGFFYVPNAATEKDAKGRLVIPAQDFVSKYRIRTVCGVGATYSTGTMAAAILFATRAVTIAATRHLQPLIDAFVSSTTAHVLNGDLFAE
jgi:hypothetical protein